MSDPATGSEPTVLDCRGQRCPRPIIELARLLPEVPIGVQILILADDPAAANDIPAWCRLRGQEFCGQDGSGRLLVRRLG